MKKRLLLPLLCPLVAAGFLLAGCGEKARSFALVVECDEATSRRSVEVDLVGVNASDRDELLAYSINKYWQPDDRKRASLTDRVTKKFGVGQPRRHVMSLKDAEVKQTWATWMGRGVNAIIIIANLKTVTTDASGIADPRRKLIELKPKALEEMYPNAKAFRVLVQEASVRIDPLDEVPKDAAK